MPKTVRIVEVGPRDGLQNEKGLVQTSDKVELISLLAKAGLSSIEATSFVSPKWVPQMGDNKHVMEAIPKLPSVRYSVLTPNMKGYEGARASGAEEVAVFVASSDAFNKKNINCTTQEALEKVRPMCERAKQDGVIVRGYTSTVLGCPYVLPASRVTPQRSGVEPAGLHQIHGRFAGTQATSRRALSLISLQACWRWAAMR